MVSRESSPRDLSDALLSVPGLDPDAIQECSRAMALLRRKQLQSEMNRAPQKVDDHIDGGTENIASTSASLTDRLQHLYSSAMVLRQEVLHHFASDPMVLQYIDEALPSSAPSLPVTTEVAMRRIVDDMMQCVHTILSAPQWDEWKSLVTAAKMVAESCLLALQITRDPEANDPSAQRELVFNGSIFGDTNVRLVIKEGQQEVQRSFLSFTATVVQRCDTFR